MTSISEIWKFEPFHPELNRKKFDCGNEYLNQYLKNYATQDIKRSLSYMQVAVSLEETSKILGYYTFSAGSIGFEELPSQKKMPKYPIPIARIGRLAVDISVQGKGLGKELLMDALYRAKRLASTEIGIAAVIVDAKDENAKSFYLKYGFQSLRNPLILFISIKTITPREFRN